MINREMVDRITEVFIGTASSAVEAQNALGVRSRGLIRPFAIPRISVSTLFRTSVENGKTAIFFGRNTGQGFENTLDFSLVLSPAAIPAAAIPDTPTSRTHLPPFLVLPAERREVIRRLEQCLRSIDALRYRRELAKLDAAIARASPAEGLVFLRVGPGRRYLAVRLDSPGGIFVVDLERPDADHGSIEVYSFDGADADAPILWEPFELCFSSLRAWQRSGVPALGLDGADVPAKLGQIAAAEFARALWEGFRDALRILASRGAMGAGEVTTHYELAAAKAILNYTATGGSDSVPLVRSRVQIALQAGGERAPSMDVKLDYPEFIVSGEAREVLLEMLASNLKLSGDSSDSLWSCIDKGDEREYRESFDNPAKVSDALILLASPDEKPANRFLFAWTSRIGDKEREFLFSAEASGGKLSKPELLKPLDDPLQPGGSGSAGSQRPAPEATIAASPGYAGLRDFLCAVRQWDLAGGWDAGATT
jgi:hypothetical protein